MAEGELLMARASHTQRINPRFTDRPAADRRDLAAF
jgi:hypothetical protein